VQLVLIYMTYFDDDEDVSSLRLFFVSVVSGAGMVVKRSTTSLGFRELSCSVDELLIFLWPVVLHRQGNSEDGARHYGKHSIASTEVFRCGWQLFPHI